MQAFEGRVAVVTGAASGMGRAFAERFAREGMKVVLADVQEDALEATVRAMRANELDVIGVPTDVASLPSVEALARAALDRYGRVHVVCNNAGVAGDLDFLGERGRPLWEYSMRDWEWTFGVNVWGVVHGIRVFLPLMLEHGEEGHVVNTASMAGLLSGPTAGIYGTTKHAVVRITEALYYQLGQMNAKVKASVLCPGIINTRIFSSGRNRPDVLWDPGARPSGDEYERRLAEGDAFFAHGLAPEEVAEQVLQAIRDERFYILTRDVPMDRVRMRFDNILATRNPEIPPLPR
ncbi:MAG: SDR family NAD(P)-dependent oxidoreductase [Chloroflexi bacterium]|nr:SDR family NAD(P)-dependent oxidoreductase [Chloroflexota bacterium]